MYGHVAHFDFVTFINILLLYVICFSLFVDSFIIFNFNNVEIVSFAILIIHFMNAFGVFFNLI